MNFNVSLVIMVIPLRLMVVANHQMFANSSALGVALEFIGTFARQPA
jgi:hypothetical protein